MAATATRHAPRSGRPKLMDDEKLEAKMMAAAQKLLMRQKNGFALNFEHLNLETVMRKADVSRSAVYRVFPNKESFNRALLKSFASPQGSGPGYGQASIGPFDEQTAESAAAILQESEESLSTAAGRATVLHRLVIDVVGRAFKKLVDEERWRRYVVLTMASSQLDDEDFREEIMGDLRASEDRYMKGFEALLKYLFDELHLQPKPPFDESLMLATLARLTVANFEGLSLQHVPNHKLIERKHEFPSGSWSLATMGFAAALNLVAQHEDGGLAVDLTRTAGD